MLLKMIHNLKYELFIFGTLTLIFLDSGWPYLTKTTESKPQIRGDYCATFVVTFPAWWDENPSNEGT
jgi:hypothetical protein